jgi:putative ABC transport system ATP-binding protein
LKRAEAAARARELLGFLGLAARESHRPAELSGGEQQRVALARALAPNPAILVADEPTGNLDEATGRAIIDLLFSERQRSGATLVLVTHDPALAARCGRTLRMASGRLEAAAPAPAGA